MNWTPTGSRQNAASSRQEAASQQKEAAGKQKVELGKAERSGNGDAGEINYQ
jgi:hypothetical protein